MLFKNRDKEWFVMPVTTVASLNIMERVHQSMMDAPNDVRTQEQKEIDAIKAHLQKHWDMYLSEEPTKLPKEKILDIIMYDKMVLHFRGVGERPAPRSKYERMLPLKII